MEVGIGLPNAVAGTTGEQLVERRLRCARPDYYDWLGEYADQIVSSTATDPETVRQYVSAFEQAGCDELIFFPGVGRPGAGRATGRSAEGLTA